MSKCMAYLEGCTAAEKTITPINPYSYASEEHGAWWYGWYDEKHRISTKETEEQHDHNRPTQRQTSSTQER